MMLDLAGVAEGSRVLDVGAGAGDSTVVAARRVGPRGRVLAADVSAGMLAAAAELARHAGLANADTRVADAQRLDLPPDSFDAAISRNCLMLIPDYQQALTCVRRVLKPGGRFAAIVFSAPGRCPFLSIPHAIVFRIGRVTSPAPERFGEFRLGAPGVLEDAFGTAGFREVSVRTVPTRRRFPGRQPDGAQRLHRRPGQEDQAHPGLPDDDGPQLRRGLAGARLAAVDRKAPGVDAGELEARRRRDHRRFRFGR
jgi:SAM-dependent methyltransferase